MWDPYADFQKMVLSNGLTVYALHMPKRPQAMGFMVHAGAEYDPVGKPGVAHFAEHLVSKNLSIPHEDAEAFFEDQGGNVRFGSTGYPATEYSFFLPNDNSLVARGLDIFGEMLFSAKLEKRVEEEREIILREHEYHWKDQEKLTRIKMERETVYHGWWLERSYNPLGNPSSIKAITQPDVRQFYENHYTPANTSMVAVGGMEPDELFRLASESLLAAKKPGARIPQVQPAQTVEAPLHTYCVQKSKDSACSYRTVALVPGNAYVKIEVLCKMLGKILDQEVRQKRQWTYAAGCGCYDFRHFHGFAAHCSDLAEENLPDMELLVNDCINRLHEAADLFEKIRNSLIKENGMRDWGIKALRNGAMQDLENFQRIITLSEYGRMLQTMTIDDIRGLLPWICPERRWTLICKP